MFTLESNTQPSYVILPKSYMYMFIECTDFYITRIQNEGRLE